MAGLARHIAPILTRRAAAAAAQQVPRRVLASLQSTAPLGSSHYSRASLHTSSAAAMPTRRVTPSELLERNASYPEELWVTDRDRIQANKVGQNPSILWIGCSDSRVPESVVTRCKPGDIFVHRNIANQFNEHDDSANSVITYGVDVLGVDHIIVVGHTGCGGVRACLGTAATGKAPPSAALQRFLGPLVSLCNSVREQAGLKQGDEPSDVEELEMKTTEANVKEQIRKIVASEVVKANWAGKKSTDPDSAPAKRVEVHGWIHDVGTGKLRDLQFTQKPPA